jgi:outer membrane protein TolC
LAADLLAILQRPGRSRAAAHRLEGVAAAALSSALDVIAAVRDLYATAQVLEALVPLLDGRLAMLDRLSEVAAARVELGEGIGVDVTALAAQRSELAVAIARRRQELRLARLALCRRIGEPTSAAGWRLDGWTGPPAIPTEESPWIETALRSRPEVLAIQWEIRALQQDAALAGWLALDGASIGVEGEREDDWSVGPRASAPLPLFDTGAARKRRASALAVEAGHRLVAARRKAVEEVRAALAAFEGSRANLERVVAELIPLQERRRFEIEEAFRLGQVDVTALLLAEQALQETQALRVGLEGEVTKAVVLLERSVGGRAAFAANLAQDERSARP